MSTLPKSLLQRQKWYNKLWWIREVSIKNPEWRELLIDDGVHTLSIEWEFNNKWDLEKVLNTPWYEQEWVQKILNFFDAATIAYNYGMIEHSEKQDLHMPLKLLHTIHARLFFNAPRQFSQQPGTFAQHKREMTSKSFEPLSPHRIEPALQSLMKVFSLETVTLIEKIIFFHAAFEYIHPYPDGNGRVGRIAMNTLLIMAWLPNIAIKGIEKKDREIYYNALANCDTETKKWLNGTNLKDIDFSVTKPFQKILIDGLKQSMDTVICRRFEEKWLSLLPAREVAVMLGKNPNTFAVQCTNKAVINVVRKHKAYTHPDLCTDPESVG